MQYKELTSKIISCAFEVHRYFGNGFLELIYQRALAIEMEEKGLSFIQEYSMDIEYKGTLIGTRRVDFLVEDCVMLELKAVRAKIFSNKHKKGPANALTDPFKWYCTSLGSSSQVLL